MGPGVGGTLRAKAEGYLRQALGDPRAGFRDGQWRSVELLAQERSRALLVQRTGWGKSIVYFLATRLIREAGGGPTLLISPLLALMRNQTLAAQRLGIRAETLNSSNPDEWPRISADLKADRVDVLLVSPERLANESFRTEVLLPVERRVGLLVVDEAHCISDWGHDFRPHYRRIVRVLKLLPRSVPVLATTATANDRVIRDVQEQLGPGLTVLRGPLSRESLCLQVLRLPEPAARLAWLAKYVPLIPRSGVIYVLTVRDAERVAEWLRSRDITAEAYYADLEAEERVRLETALLENGIKVLVATTALSMGFDKPDLGFVIHYQRPASVVHYYQQVGRAGRALPRAYGVLLSGAEDQEIADYFLRTAFPPESDVEEVLEALRGAPEGLRQREIERSVNLGASQISKVLSLLSVETPSPVSHVEGRWRLNPVPYSPDRERIHRVIQLRQEEQAQMEAYLKTRECLMSFLVRALDGPDPAPCGRCANCKGRLVIPGEYVEEDAEAARALLRRAHHTLQPRRQWPGDALEAHGWKGRIAEELQPEPGRALCVWGDPGWGAAVRRGKQVEGRFGDELVAAAAELVRGRWNPAPSPAWVTCVPSLEHASLVPDFAERLAAALGLPFRPCVRKVRATEPQKLMRNSHQQARNLSGAFRVEPFPGIELPVLLVDDMADSRWTFTVVSALLREAGSGPVFPLALAAVLMADD